MTHKYTPTHRIIAKYTNTNTHSPSITCKHPSLWLPGASTRCCGHTDRVIEDNQLSMIGAIGPLVLLVSPVSAYPQKR